MNFIREVRAEIVEENGEKIPAFIFTVPDIDRVYDIMKNFPVTPMPINVPMISQMIEDEMPADKLLRIELAFEDPLPDNAFEVFLDENETEQFKEANKNSRKIKYILTEKKPLFGKAKRRDLITHENYILDWQGIHGIVFLRRIHMKDANEEKVQELIKIFDAYREEYDLATGMYTELGYLYRMIEDFDSAKECYLNEIKGAAKEGHSISMGAAKALNNLAVIFKRTDETEKALLLYKLALALNPNYFEALLGVAGLVDFDLSVMCAARAQVIRPNNPHIHSLVQNMINAFELDEGEVIGQLNMALEHIDLSQSPEGLSVENVAETVKDLFDREL